MILRATAFILLLGAVSADATAAAVARQGQVVMGTVLTVTVVADDERAARAMAVAAIEEAQRWDDALTIWRPEGELARLNRTAGQGEFSIGARLEEGLRAMLRLARDTGGAFEPTVGRLPDKGDPGSKLVGIRRSLTLREHRARLEPGAVLDPGGIGKGLALDAIATLLHKSGAKAAFLDFGGSSQTGLGVPPGDAEGWTVVVSGALENSSHGTVRLRDDSLSTSNAGAEDTKPILDPRSGRPVGSPRLVTVRSKDATAADAWSTALVVLGRPGMEAARKAGLEVLLEDGEGTLVTPGFGLLPERRPVDGN